MLRLATSVVVLIFATHQAFAQSLNLPIRDSVRPQITKGVPHVQIGVEANAELTAELLRRVAQFTGVKLGPTRVSLPGATGFQLKEGVKLERPEAIVGGREFAHIHPDGSLHASLHPQTAQSAINAGWAVLHPWANKREGWKGFVMIYTPQTDQELEVVFELIENSYKFITGRKHNAPKN